MKYPRIFLGVTTTILVAAGLTAAKRFGSTHTAYYCTLGSSGLGFGKCIAIQSTCTGAGVLQCYYDFTVDGIVYSANVYRSGINGQPCTSACFSPIKYEIEH